ncbi:MAG TPA: prepilin-type N-terminal cleavage/methylation domain-containing protein [Acidimicrobiales bacterium]|nr:prepilin-type N-terminal cleavage/methylation domain-containing protein [Acidimicrobiales bacterium]
MESSKRHSYFVLPLFTTAIKHIVRRRAVTLRDEGGFTLIELLIVVIIMPLVVGAMGLGLITILQMQTSVTSSTGNTADAQITASVFVKDVQSASDITAMPTPIICNAPGETTDTQLLGLQWDNGQGSNGEDSVSYVSVPVTVGSTTTYSLVRQRCTSGNYSAPSSTTVSNNFPAGTIADVAPTLTPTCTTFPQSCDPKHVWLRADLVKSVMIKFVEGDNVGSSTVPFTYFLQATPRIWTSSFSDASSGGPPYAPLILLGGTSSTDPPTGCVSGSAMTVKEGSVSINVAGGSGNGGVAIASNCPDSVNVSSNGTLSVGPVMTENDSGSASIQATNNSTLVAGTESTPSFKIYDPYADLMAPISPTSPGACSPDPSTGIYYCTPGFYTGTQSFPNGSQVVFVGGGNYEFQNGLALPGGTAPSAIFATGSYIFDGTNALTMGTSGMTISGNNVLFYITGQNATFANNSNINLTPEDGNQGVTIWDASLGGTLTLANNSTSTVDTNSYGGIYAPYATVSTTQNGTVTCAFIVTNSASFVNNTVINITSP